MYFFKFWHLNFGMEKYQNKEDGFCIAWERMKKNSLSHMVKEWLRRF